MEVGVDMSTNYANDQVHEVPFNVPSNYDPKDASRRLVNVFDMLTPRLPRNRQVQPPPKNR